MGSDDQDRLVLSHCRSLQAAKAGSSPALARMIMIAFVARVEGENLLPSVGCPFLHAQGQRVMQETTFYATIRCRSRAGFLLSVLIPLQEAF